MTIGELLGIAREVKGVTLRELEKQTGLSNALISQIEKGHVLNPGFFTVVKLATALGLPLERVASTSPQSIEERSDEVEAEAR